MTDDLNISPMERLRALLAGVFLLSIVAAIAGLLPWWTVLAVLALAGFANSKLVALFYRRKGALFALSGLLYHQLYYLYSSAAFVYSWLLWKFTGSSPAPGKG